jgi:hypothetical protein
MLVRYPERISAQRWPRASSPKSTRAVSVLYYTSAAATLANPRRHVLTLSPVRPPIEQKMPKTDDKGIFEKRDKLREKVCAFARFKRVHASLSFTHVPL